MLKKAHAPAENHRELFNDALFHQRICKAFDRSNNCKCPSFIELIHPSYEDWWKVNGSLIPLSEVLIARTRERSPILESERTWPLPSVVREALITTFCPNLKLQEQARENKGSRDCLIRIYLGARNHLGQFNTKDTFSLGNFPLSLDKMEVLDLNKLRLAALVAEGLATLHWGAKTDARDVWACHQEVPGSNKPVMS